jgi:hypothetical protein
MKLQLERMHSAFGRNPVRKCRDCSNLIQGGYCGRNYCKCERYGLSHSESSDWAMRWEACGAFNSPLPDGRRTVLDMSKHAVRKQPDEPLEGQMTLC